MAILAIFLSFLSVFGMAYALIPIVHGQAKKKGRSVYEQVERRSAAKEFAAPILKLLSTYNKGLGLKSYERRILRKLNAAGRPAQLDPAEFLAVKELAALALTVAAALLLGLLGTVSVLFTLIFGALGFFLPDLWLVSKIKERHAAILKTLPYNLDLLTLSVEAGMDFASAVGKVVETGQAGPLIEELYQMLREIQMGKTRRDALRDMSERINLQEMTSFTTALIQADQLGTSLGPVLRIQADQMNSKREQKTEKKAMEAPVKMLFPLIAFIFPTIFIMIFIPIIIQMQQQGIF